MKILMTLMGLEIGGAETHVVELSKELKKQGHDVLVASNGGVYEQALLDAGIRHHKIPLHPAEDDTSSRRGDQAIFGRKGRHSGSGGELCRIRQRKSGKSHCAIGIGVVRTDARAFDRDAGEGSPDGAFRDDGVY